MPIALPSYGDTVLNALLEYISLYRVVWIRGRLGFGKTAIATLIAKALLENGLVDGVITNYPCILPTHVNQDDGTLRNRCIVYDEAWADLDSRTSMTNDRAYGAYARKLGAYWLFPSVHPIDKRLRAIEVAPSHRNIINGNNVFTFAVNDGSKEQTTGKFSIDIKKAYGLYATAYIPTGDCGISARFQYSYYIETGELYNAKEYASRQSRELEAVSDTETTMA